MVSLTYLIPDPNFYSSLDSVHISSDGLSVTLSSIIGYVYNFQAIGNDPVGSSAYYFETTIGADWGSGATSFGIIDSLFDPGISGGNTVRGTQAHSATVIENGTIYVAGASTGITIPNYTANAVYGTAVNFATNLIWFRQGAGLWNNSSTADPATGVGGIDISGLTGPFVPVVAFQGGTGTLSFNFGQNAYANAAPAGFNEWPTTSPTFGARVSQTGMDALKDNASANVRVSYEAIETINAQTTANVRVSYESVETLTYLDSTNARASQIVLQVLTPVFVPTTGANTNIIIVS